MLRRLSLLVLLTACPGGKTASQVIQPKVPTVASADKTPIAVCKGGERHALMVVDWTPEARADLEVAMKEGVAVVAYDCKSVELVPACSIQGTYGYIGTTRREKKIELTTNDEIAANLPVGGLSWLSDLGGKLDRESALVAQLVMVGKRSSAKKSAQQADLENDCGGATHFVRAATVGAFVVASGSKAELAASAKIIGKGASGASSSSTKVRAQDGDLEACMTSSPDGKVPPDQCGAVVRIELEPIGMNRELAPDLVVTACPPGLARDGDGVCRKPDVPHQCKPGDATACTAQCEAGHAGSCATLSAMYREGTGLEKNWAKAAELAITACDAGVPAGCRIAAAAKLGGQGVAKDPGRALAMLDQACQAGDGMGCVELGVARLDNPKLARDAQYAFRRACYGGGEHEGCAWLGTLYAEGKGGMKVRPKIAVKFFEKGCKEGSMRACTGLGKLVQAGKQGVPKDRARATELFTTACNAGYEPACKHK